MRTETSVLLIDGDILCYKAAFTAQDSIDWGDGEEPQILTNLPKAQEILADAIALYRDVLGCPSAFVCISDDRNWRKELWPEYKAHRANQAKPLLLDACKAFLREHYSCLTSPRLEADDVMGIGATANPDAVMVSIDKDMRTVPGKLYNPNRPEEGVVQSTIVEAFKYHMTQTLTGDSTDGYKGCPGIGPKKAEAILGAVPTPKTNNPDTIKEWKKELWTRISKSYEEKGLTEKEALLNARLANILTCGRYDAATSLVKLWSPPR